MKSLDTARVVRYIYGMIIYMFVAVTVDKQGKRSFPQTLIVEPGKTNLFQDIRALGEGAELGRYRRLDLNPDSQTHGYHLFEHGIVKLHQVHI